MAIENLGYFDITEMVLSVVPTIKYNSHQINANQTHESRVDVKIKSGHLERLFFLI